MWDGIYELRARSMGVNYRILYCFHGLRAVLCRGLTKSDEVPGTDIERAIALRAAFGRDPEKHTYQQ
jgi:putative component of toxin-antitoxin plasmid stabilization module